MFSGIREAIETLYQGRMTVIEYQPVKDQKTGLTSRKEVEVMADIPCRLSYSESPIVTAGNAAENIQRIKVFFAPNITVRPGSKLIIRQNGTEAAYQSSGVPKVYSSHAEVELEYFKRWA